MPQDKRTTKFKKDRKERLKAGARTQISDPVVIRNPTIHYENPDKCIWCDFPLQGTKAVCPHCHNCQSCGLLNAAAGLEACYLCGNRVPKSRIPDKLPNFHRPPGKRGFIKKARKHPGIHHKNH